MSALDNAIRGTYRELAAAKEEYLLSFFGSREAAERDGHLYVFEENPVQVSENEGVFSARQEFRLRPKTAEELALTPPARSTGEAKDG